MTVQTNEASYTSVHETIKRKSFEFKTVKDVTKFNNKTKTDQAAHLATHIRDCVKICGDNVIYYFNDKTKLWEKNR
jgi:hypothetical protein